MEYVLKEKIVQTIVKMLRKMSLRTAVIRVSVITIRGGRECSRLKTAKVSGPFSQRSGGGVSGQKNLGGGIRGGGRVLSEVL